MMFNAWFSHLLPPELRHYFRIKVNSNKVGKDDLIAMSQFGLVCYEELDVMRPSEVNTMKTVVTISTSCALKVPSVQICVFVSALPMFRTIPQGRSGGRICNRILQARTKPSVLA